MDDLSCSGPLSPSKTLKKTLLFDLLLLTHLLLQVVVSAVAVATFVLEFIKRTERKHSSVSFYSHASIRDFLPLLFSFLIQNRIFLSAGSAAAASEFFQDPISSKQVIPNRGRPS